MDIYETKLNQLRIEWKNAKTPTDRRIVEIRANLYKRAQAKKEPCPKLLT